MGLYVRKFKATPTPKSLILKKRSKVSLAIKKFILHDNKKY